MYCMIQKSVPWNLAVLEFVSSPAGALPVRSKSVFLEMYFPLNRNSSLQNVLLKGFISMEYTEKIAQPELADSDRRS